MTARSMPTSCCGNTQRFNNLPPLFMMSFHQGMPLIPALPKSLYVFLPFFVQTVITSPTARTAVGFFCLWDHSVLRFSRAFISVTSSANSSADPAGSP